MDFIAALKIALEACIPNVAKDAEVSVGNLSEMEVAVKEMLQGVGNEVMRQWLEAQDEKYPMAQRAWTAPQSTTSSAAT